MVVIIIVFFIFSETKDFDVKGAREIKLARSYDDVALCN